MDRALLRRVVFAAATTFAVACTSPTLPLPPPTSPSITTGSEPGTVHLASTEGSAPNALIVVVNRNTDLPAAKRVTGTFADARGTWELDVIASPGDVLDITQEAEAVRSPPTTVTIR